MRTLKNLLIALACVASLSACQSEKKAEINFATINMRYDTPEDSNYCWTDRKVRMAKFITDQALDIFGTQELLCNQVDDLKALLPDYEMVGVGRIDGVREGEYASIFYRRDRFETLDGGTFWLSEYPDSVGLRGWDANEERIATWAKLRDKASGKVFMTVNTHFDDQGVIARRESALLIIKKVKEIVGDNPTIVCGDFNVTEDNEAYRTVTTNEYVLKDAHKIAEKVEGVNYTWQDYGRAPENEREKLDFIFVTPSISVKQVYIPKEDANNVLSDHNPYLAKLQF